jgi:hypothetical protein
MIFKLLTGALLLLLVGESLFIVMQRHPTNRFEPVEGYEPAVAFDTVTGQLCKTLRTKSATEIEKADAEAVKKPVPCPPPPVPSGDSLTDRIARSYTSKSCGVDNEDVAQKSVADSTLVFIAKLPACADIR